MKVHSYNIYIIILTICLLFYGCGKTGQQGNISNGSGNGNGNYTISGFIYQDCAKQPVANTTFTFWQPGAYGGDVGTATTNAAGHFSLSYKPVNGNHIKYGVPNQFGYADYGQIAPGNYTNIILYKYYSCYLKVSMQVYNNSYTNQDTFYIGDFGKNGGNPTVLKIPGPFHSGPMFEVANYPLLNYVYGGINLPLIFRLNNTEINQGTVKLVTCDTSNIIAEIR